MPNDLRVDYSSIVERYRARIQGHLVLFEGHRDGDFIFAVRRVLGRQKAVIMRGSKLFYSVACDDRFGKTSYVQSTQQVRELIDQFGFETIIVERRNLLNRNETDLLFAELDDQSRYELLGAHTLDVQRPGYERRRRIVEVYRLKRPRRRTIRYVDIPIPRDNRSLRIDLEQLLVSSGPPVDPSGTDYRTTGTRRPAHPNGQ